jgi:hypothetical protein
MRGKAISGEMVSICVSVIVYVDCESLNGLTLLRSSLRLPSIVRQLVRPSIRNPGRRLARSRSRISEDSADLYLGDYRLTMNGDPSLAIESFGGC